MSNAANKSKVLTKVEREMHALLNLVLERGIDTAMLFAKRNKIDIEDRILEKLLDLVRNGANDAFMQHVERTTSTLSAAIEPYLRDDEDPLS